MSKPSYLEVLTPQNSQVLFIDQQPQMAFGVQSIDRQVLKNNVVGLAKAAKAFKIPATITTVETDGFSGNTYPELLAVFPDNKLLERTSMNSWDDQNVRDALAANAAQGRKKVVVSGLWTEVCNMTFALSCLNDTDYEIYMVADASGGTWIAWSRQALSPSPGSRFCSSGSATGRGRTPTMPLWRSLRSIRAPMAWASTTPIRWSTRPRNV